MWSEHCSYKSSRAHLRQLPTTGPQVVQGPGENAGAVDIGDGLLAVFKIESHNHPSFVEPFQGAATGVGGILRDVFTMGARPIAILDSLRFGAVDHPRTPFLVRGVVGGIAHYGNCIGVPTVGGDVYFDPGYNGNILVNAFTLGIARRDRLFRAKAGGVGNPGHVRRRAHRARRHPRREPPRLGRVRRDVAGEAARRAGGRPVHREAAPRGVPRRSWRATTSSPSRTWARPASRPARSRWRARGGAGMVLDLDAVPLREEGMTPYEILLSESQERMLIVAKAGHEEAVRAVFARWDLEAAVIGHVSDDGVFRVRWRGEEVCALPVDGAHRRRARLPAPGRGAGVARGGAAPRPPRGEGAERPLADAAALLESPNLCSREWVYPPVRSARRRQHGRARRAATPPWCASRARERRSR